MRAEMFAGNSELELEGVRSEFDKPVAIIKIKKPDIVFAGYKFKRSVGHGCWDKGYQGFVSFTSKTKLIGLYEKSLGATYIGAHKMVIFPTDSFKLIKKYYPS